MHDDHSTAGWGDGGEASLVSGFKFRVSSWSRGISAWETRTSRAQGKGSVRTTQHADETAHDTSYWEKEKARLEAYKLRLESQNYEQRLRLEDEKLKSDVKDWYFRVMAAVLTMIATGASFFIGRIYENSTDQSKQRFELMMARERAENDDFNKSVSSLTSSNAGERAAGAAVLQWYLKRAEADAQDETGAEQAKLRIDRALRMIAVRMPSENDTAVLQEYSAALVDAGQWGLPYAVSINRQAGPQLVRSAAAYIAWNLRDPVRFQPEGCQNDPNKNQHNSQNQEEVAYLTGDVDYNCGCVEDVSFYRF